MVHEACVGLKRKRDTESNASEDEVKILKVSKIDQNKSTKNTNSEDLHKSDDVISDKHRDTHCGDVSLRNQNDVENANDSIVKELIESKSGRNLSDSSASNLEKENDRTDNDENTSSIISDDLNSSAANGLLDVSMSSLNTSIENHQSGKCNDVEASTQSKNALNSIDVTNNATEKIKKKKKRMTPEEAELKTKQREQREKERELRRQEALAKKEEKRILKEKKELEKKLALEEKQKQKESEEKLRLEKKRLEELQKEEKNRLKQLALEAKAEEKKKKEEQKQKALEEKLKALEEKRKAEEEKTRIEQEKERKTKEAFVNFFVRSGFSISQSMPQSKEVVFRPFQVTEGMILAPLVPPAARLRFNKEVLDQFIHAQDVQSSEDLYLSLLKSGKYEILKNQKKRSRNELCDDIILINDKNAPELNLKAKLLQFCENVRPAYWGTWRKKSKNVNPRNPFCKDDILDYEVDSDDEWDEGGPGESLTGTEEEESEDDYEVDNEFFVPHGYLSAEEEGEDDDDEKRTTDPEELKMRLKMKEKEFLYERKRKTTELKPVILGCFFHADGTEDILAVEKSLKPYIAELLTQSEILTASTAAPLQSVDASGAVNSSASPSNEAKTKVLSIKRPVPEEGMPFLIKLVHANTNSREKVIKEFQKFWSHSQKVTAVKNDLSAKNTSTATDIYKISKRQLDVTIQNISSWIKSPDPNFKKYCWWVREDVREKYNCIDMPVPNQWNYCVSSKEEQ